MKYTKHLMLIISLAAVIGGCASPKTVIPDEAKSRITAIINQMPAPDSQHQDQLAAELAALNPQATTLLTGMLKPPTDPTDTAARYGLSALTHYTSGAGEETRKAYTDALIQALPTVAEIQNQAFIITQLQFVGKQEAVEPLAAFLNDDILCDYATRALLTIGGRDAEAAFLDAFDAASNPNKVTLIKALGEMQSKPAAKKIAPCAGSTDRPTRDVALYALANIGDPASRKLLSQASRSDDAYQRSQYTALQLLYAQRLADNGHVDLAAKICTKLAQRKGDMPNARLAAIETLRNAVGGTIEVIDDAKLRKQVKNLLAETSAQPPAGFVSLFNGKDLTGWKRHDGLPGETEPTGKWFVEDGAIVGIQDPPGQGGFLSTDKTFRNFELLLETQIDWPFDSGVFLRVGPDGKSHQVTLDYCDRGEIGGIYCPWTHGFVSHCPNGIQSFRKDQWNTLRIVCTGQPAHIQVWLNGTLINDFRHTAQTTAGIPENGTICLQIHPGGAGFDKSRARFRNIFIRPLKSDEPKNSLTAQEKAEGFVSLFNGKDLTGWVGATDSYGVQDGVLFCRKGTGRNIYTEKEYDNFVLRFEFKLEPGTNNGLGIRTPTTGDAAYVGMELQILDNTAQKYSNLHDWQYHGSVYGIIPADKAKRYSAFKPVGRWNVEEVFADGDHIIVNVNGETIVDGNIREASKNGTEPVSGKEHPGLFNKKGHIGFLGHGDYVEFRNLRIKPL